MSSDHGPMVFWHRTLPPVQAELMDEHTIEATSSRVSNTLIHRDDLWNRCYDELIANASARIVQEVDRLKGRYAHVHDESIETKRDEATGEAWLHGRFDYMLYGRVTD